MPHAPPLAGSYLANQAFVSAADDCVPPRGDPKGQGGTGGDSKAAGCRAEHPRAEPHGSGCFLPSCTSDEHTIAQVLTDLLDVIWSFLFTFGQRG